MWWREMVSSGSGWGPAAGSCEYGIEPSVPQKTGNLLTKWDTVNFTKRNQVRGIK